MEAVGIQEHPVMKLGLRPPTPEAPRLLLEDFLTGVIPSYPKSADYLQGLAFGLYGNDRWGVCGPTAVANYRRLITARLSGAMVAPSQNAVFDLYRRSGNPRFNPNLSPNDPRQQDDGVNMQQMLQAVQDGGIDGVKCLGFASVNVRNLDSLDAAIAIFGGILFGVNLEVAQQAQTNAGMWDYVLSPQWGGHAVLGGAYPETDGNDIITWAQRVRMSDNFIRHQAGEAWVAIFPEHLTDRGFLAGVDLKAFASAYEAMTGKRFPAVLPPPPPPSPPPPTPGLTLEKVKAASHAYLADKQAKNPAYKALLGQYQDGLDAALAKAFGG